MQLISGAAVLGNSLTVDTVEAVHLHETLRALGECESRVVVGGNRSKVGTVFPSAAYREENFELRILPFHFVQSIQATVRTVDLNLSIGILIRELSPRLECRVLCLEGCASHRYTHPA